MEHVKYFHTHETHVKLRWKNKPLIDVLHSEFTTRSYEYYEDAICNGVITVNNKIVSPTYKLKDLDIIRHTVHIHEPMTPKIEIIAEEQDYCVVNKPPGIPCHPTGGYFLYSVTKSLFKDQSVGCVNRLDMPVSGVLILTFNNSDHAHNSLKSAEKIYIAKVKGDFPEYVEVDQPIGLTTGRIHDVCESGKPSKTIFKKLGFKDGYSLVQCQPITGRTHQIRIHLKYIGFPVLHDILYGDGKAPEIFSDSACGCHENIDNFEDKEKYRCILRHCRGVNNRTFQIKNAFICLHAWKYVFNDIEYVAKLPEWAFL